MAKKPTRTLAATKPVSMPTALRHAGLCDNETEAIEHIKNGKVQMNGEVVKDPGFTIALGRKPQLQLGRKKQVLEILNADAHTIS